MITKPCTLNKLLQNYAPLIYDYTTMHAVLHYLMYQTFRKVYTSMQHRFNSSSQIDCIDIVSIFMDTYIADYRLALILLIY